MFLKYTFLVYLQQTEVSKLITYPNKWDFEYVFLKDMQKDNNNFAQDLEILNDFLTNVSVNFPCPHISSFCIAQRFNVVNFPHFCFLLFCLLNP